MSSSPPTSGPSSSSLSSTSSQPRPGAAPPLFPALGAAFPSLAGFKQAAVDGAQPNRLLVSTHRPGIKMGLECSLTGRKRKQRGGGDKSGGNAGCGFLVVCELVDDEGRAVGKGKKVKATFRVTELTPHNHKPPVVIKNGVSVAKARLVPEREEVGVAKGRKVWDRTERDREVLADSAEYKLFAREMGLAPEEVNKMVCWQMPVPRPRTRSANAVPEAGSTGPSGVRDDDDQSAALALAQLAASPQPLSAASFCAPSQRAEAVPATTPVNAGCAISPRTPLDAATPPWTDPVVPCSAAASPPPPAECFATAGISFVPSLLEQEHQAHRAGSPERALASASFTKGGHLPSPSLSPETSRPTVRPSSLEQHAPTSPTATQHSTGTKRKLVLQVKASALKHQGALTKKAKLEPDDEAKPTVAPAPAASVDGNESEVVKRLKARFIRDSAEPAALAYSPDELPAKLCALATAEFAIPPISLAWLPLLAKRPPLHLLPPLPLHLAFSSSRAADHWAPVEAEMGAVEYLYRRQGDITVEQVAALRAREPEMWRWVEVLRAMWEINAEWTRVARDKYRDQRVEWGSDGSRSRSRGRAQSSDGFGGRRGVSGGSEWGGSAAGGWRGGWERGDEFW